MNDAAAMQGCADCGSPAIDRYCGHCGQRNDVNRSLGSVAHEIFHSVVHVETKGWRTLIELAMRPGVLTRRYIAGQRTRHLSPVTMFLTTAFLMFFALGLIGVSTSPARHQALDRMAECPATEPMAAADAAAQPPLAVHRYEPLIRWLVRSAPTALQGGFCRALHNPELFVSRVQKKAYKFGFLLVPLSIPVLWLMFLFRPDTRLYDHAVFSLYSISFMSLLAVLAFLLRAAGVGALAPYLLLLGVFPLVHMYLHLKQSYLLSTAGALWRTVVLAGAAVATLALFVLGTLIFGLLG